MYTVLLTKHSGWFLGPIAEVLGKILEAIYSFLNTFGVQNVGVCIILFTFIVNAIMIPLTIKQQRFSKLSAQMNPEIMKIQEKYKGKKDNESMQRMQAEQQVIYQKYGVSPTSGCLPLLITFPIFFALYRVIYNVPAYVPLVKDLYETIAEAIQKTSGYGDILQKFVSGTEGAMNSPVTVTSLSKLNVLDAITTDPNKENFIIDILTQFKEVHWQTLMDQFNDIKVTIKPAYDNIKSVNSFLGMNILENPSIKSLTVLVPVFAVVTQFVQNRMMMSPTKTGDGGAAASSMKAMNNIMPFMSGFFCLMFPIGVGIYWVAGSVFRIIQSFFMNLYMNKIDVDTLIEKNTEKRKKKMERKGLDPNMSMKEFAKKRTSSIQNNAGITVNKKSNSGNSNIEANKNFEPGSISGYANMLSRKNGNSKKEEK